MDSPNCSDQQPINPSGQPQNDQGGWIPAGVSNLSMLHAPHQPEQTAHQIGHPPRHPPRPSSAPGPVFQQNQALLTPFVQGQGVEGSEEIRAYLHIPCINKLHNEYFVASSNVNRLYDALHKVNEEMDQMRVRLIQLQGPTSYAMYRRTVSGSLAPSDSLSQQLSRQSSGSFENNRAGDAPVDPIPRPQPPNRPEHFPFEILWDKEDCKVDKLGAQPVQSNNGRPRMKSAIRNKDGTVISKTYFRTIQRAVKKRMATLIQEEEERLQTRLPPEKMTKTYFETARAKQWGQMIELLEREHPVLSYAAGNWKTEQLMTNRLTSFRSHKKKGGQQAKKKKSTTKSSGKPEDSDSSDSSEEERDEDSENEKIVVGSKRKRGKLVSNPSEISSSRPSVAHVELASVGQDTPSEIRSQGQQDVEMEAEPSSSTRPISEVMAEKRMGKQAQANVFAAISAAALRIGKPREDPQLDPTNHPGTSKTSPLYLITVDASYEGIKDVLSTSLSKNVPPHGVELLEALEKMSKIAALDGDPSPTALQLIERIESADPNAPDVDEDNTNLGWGHMQFTAGNLTCRSVLRTWEDIGNVKMAYRLLAATVKTCLVARHLCFTNNINASESPSSYLSDSYLREVVEILWNLREPEQDLPPASGPSAGNTTSTDAIATLGSAQLSKSDSKRLERLHAEELRTWMSVRSIPLPAHPKRKKNDLIVAIIGAPGDDKIPTDVDIERIVSQRVPHKRGSAKTT